MAFSLRGNKSVCPLLETLAVEGGVHRGGHFGFVESVVEEAVDGGGDSGCFGEAMAVFNFQKPAVGVLFYQGNGVLEIGGEELGKSPVWEVGSGFAVAFKHDALGRYDFADIAAHQNNSVWETRGERRQEGMDDLDGFAQGVGHPVAGCGELFDGLEFQVAPGVVRVGFAESVGQDGHAPGLEDLHHHGSARAGKTADDRDVIPGLRHGPG